MLGLVLWVRKGSGAIWCEDQDDLVFFSLDSLEDFPVDPLKVGDFVRFECGYSYGRRIAKTIELIAENGFGDTLADLLKSQAQQHEATEAPQIPPVTEAEEKTKICEFPRETLLADEPREGSGERQVQCVDATFSGQSVKIWSRGGAYGDHRNGRRFLPRLKTAANAIHSIAEQPRHSFRESPG